MTSSSSIRDPADKFADDRRHPEPARGAGYSREGTVPAGVVNSRFITLNLDIAVYRLIDSSVGCTQNGDSSYI